jgi:hypothetical protein
MNSSSCGYAQVLRESLPAAQDEDARIRSMVDSGQDSLTPAKRRFPAESPGFKVSFGDAQ